MDMMDSGFFWLFVNMLSIAVLAFYSMEEMAFVSFNKVRLQFYVAKGDKRASLVNQLLQKPSQLFGTTLIGVNVATFMGSEFARKFYESINLSPDLAPITQIFLVIIFGELAPMFAARRYSEHVALLGARLIYISSKILAPMIWFLEIISKAANRLFHGQETSPNLFITTDELQKILEEQDEENIYSETDEFNAITSNIFRLKEKLASQVMTPLSLETAVSDRLTIKQLRTQKKITTKYLIAYNRSITDVTGILYIKDLFDRPEGDRLKSYGSAPWFIPFSTPLLEILKQFRSNSENIAIVLDRQGKAVGMITFEDILDEIFGETGRATKLRPNQIMIDRTFDGHTTLEELLLETGITLDGLPEETISEWYMRISEHHPEVGESYVVSPYEFIVKETSLLGVTSIQVRTQSI